MKNLTVENVYTRHEARELTKRHFWKLLGMVILTVMITMLLTTGGTILLTQLTGATVTTASSTYAMSAQIDPQSVSAGFLAGYLALLVIATLVGTGLNLGLTRSMIDICRGDEDVSIGHLFSRMGSCLKGIGLSIWVGVKIALWALPVYAVIFAAAFFLSSESSRSYMDEETLYILLTVLPLIAIIAALALVIPAVYRYMLSTYVLADEHRTGVFACVRQSKAMMKGHKWQAFKLAFPLYLIIYAIMMLLTVATGIVTVVLGESAAQYLPWIVLAIVIVMVVVLVIYSLRIAMAYCLFYLKRKGDKSPVPVEEEERIVCWQPYDGANNSAQ